MAKQKVDISVIIPAFNEAQNIGNTINALTKGDGLEIIVVDNGSTDGTADIAVSMGAMVLEKSGGTIAAVRNHGAAKAKGKILVFIDADVIVSDEWHSRLASIVDELQQDNMEVTGSRVRPMNNTALLNRFWYSELTKYTAPYINSGHLITTRSLFDLIGGFSELLETAEDYDFCQKAKTAGAKIVNRDELVVFHAGYPTTLTGFIQRERWHGLQDVASWGEFIESKIAWFAALNLVLFILALFFTWSMGLVSFLAYIAVILVVTLFLSIYKFGLANPLKIVARAIIFFFYLWGRSLSILDRLFRRKAR